MMSHEVNHFLRRLEEQLSLNEDSISEIAPIYNQEGGTNDPGLLAYNGQFSENSLCSQTTLFTIRMLAILALTISHFHKSMEMEVKNWPTTVGLPPSALRAITSLRTLMPTTVVVVAVFGQTGVKLEIAIVWEQNGEKN